MDEVHAVLELFVSCRGSGWPLVRIEAAQKLLAQHLLMAAPMDRDEVADMIKRCFEADNNGEINFLSFWTGMENLLELLGLRDQSAYVDDKVYGLQVFRDGLLAEAVRKQEGPTSSVLLTRDEVLRIIAQTNKSVSSRHGQKSTDRVRSHEEGASDSSSSPFWDEVYKETEQLEPTSVLSVSELSMMVFGFLKTYVQEESPALRLAEHASQASGKQTDQYAVGQPVRPTTSISSSVVSEGGYAAEVDPLAQQKGTSWNDRSEDIPGVSCKESVPSSPTAAFPAPKPQSQGSGEQVYAQRPWQEWSQRESGGVLNSEGAGVFRKAEGLRARSPRQEGPEASDADAANWLKGVGIDSEDPSTQLRQMLLVAGRITEGGPLSKKDLQQLRYLNAAAVDCLDRLSIEHGKRDDEASDAVLSLRRMRTEKQQLLERLSNLEQQHSQLQLQQEQQEYDRAQVDQLKATLNSERLERDHIKQLLRDKEEELQSVIQEKEGLVEQVKAQSDDFTRRLALAQQEQVDLTAEYHDKKETLIREKETLEEQLRLAEDAARAAEAAWQQLQGDTNSSTSALRQRILELEEDKRRQEAEAEENDALIMQLQGRLEEKVQQVTILEVKNKQQLRLLQQVRGVRNSLLLLLQGEKDGETSASSVTGGEIANQNPEVLKLKAGMKAAQAHIRELESFIEEMRREQRRAVHPRYDFSAASGDSAGPSSQRRQITQQFSLPVRTLPTLGAELDMSHTVPSQERGHEGSAEPDVMKLGKGIATSANEAQGAFPPNHGAEPASDQPKAEAGSLKEHVAIAATVPSQRQQRSLPPTVFDETEQIAGVGAQGPAASTLDSAESCGIRHRRYPDRGTDSGAAYSFASLRSEPSTTDAISKEPTSCTSLAEVEDIFDPLDVLNSEEQAEAWGDRARRVRSSLQIKGQPSASGHVTSGTSEDGQARHGRSSRTPTAVPPEGLPAPDAPPDTSTETPQANSALEHLLGSKRRISRRTSSSSTVHQQRASAASSSVLSLPDMVSEPGGKSRGSVRDRNIISDSRSSAASDGGFLMLSTPRELVKSPVAAASRRSGERPQPPVQDLATRALDASTLSDMFSMLGACAPLPGNPADRAVRPADLTEKMPRKARNSDEQQQDAGKSASLGKSKHSSRLSAAAAAAMSSKDASEFRSLRRISQGSAHHGEQHEDREVRPSVASNDKGRHPAVSEKGDLSDTRCSSSAAQQTTVREPAAPLRADLPKEAARARARRTVSLGVSEAAAKSEFSETPVQPAADAQRNRTSLKSPAAAEACEQHSVRSGHCSHDNSGQPTCTLATPGAGPSASHRHYWDAQGENTDSEMESSSSSLRGKVEGTENEKGSPGDEACRSGESSRLKRNARSRSSSAETPLRRKASSHGSTAGQRQHEPEKSNDRNEAKDSGNRRDNQGTSKPSQRLYSGSQDLTSERQQPAGATSAGESQAVPNVEERNKVGRGTEVESRGDIYSSPSTSCNLTPEQRAKQQLQHVLGEGPGKLQDEQTASAAALLAAAAGVVDASLQQQQQMIQRQQEHHEDLQRAQQRRIDLLQEQLETLQKSREQQRESGEQQHKQMIETLQAKLEELQRRQDQRDQNFQEAQRRLLQEELEIQLKQKFEELRCSSARPTLEAAGVCHQQQEDPLSVRANRLRGGQFGEMGFSRGTAAPHGANDGFHGEATAQGLQESDWNRISAARASRTIVPQEATDGSIQRVNQSLICRKYDETGGAARWHCGAEEQVGCARSSEFNGSARDLHIQHVITRPDSRTSEQSKQDSDTDDASSCASSSIMGVQCGIGGPGCMVEDMPTTSSSPFISQAASPGMCSSVPSQRAGHFTTDRNFERQVYALRGDRLTPQVPHAYSLESALPRQARLRHQPSELLMGSRQHGPIPIGYPDPTFPACAVQRINSSSGSLWSPKASKRQSPALGEHTGSAGATTGTRSQTDLLTSCNSGMMTPSGGIQEASHHGGYRYASGAVRHQPAPERLSREAGTVLNGPPLSACHPVSRAERIAPVQQKPIDSARFLGNSTTTDKSADRFEASLRGILAQRDLPLKCPPASARSLGSTASYATAPAQRAPVVQTSRIPGRTRGGVESFAPSADFLATATPHATRSRRQTDCDSSPAGRTKRSGRSNCAESQASSAGCSTSQRGGRHTRSPAAGTGRESLAYGSRRTVGSLMSKLPRSSASDLQSPRLRETSSSYSVAIGTSTNVLREPFNGGRFETSEEAAAYYRRATSEALPDIEQSRAVSHRRHKVRHGNNSKVNSEGGKHPDEGQEADKTNIKDSSSSAQLSMDWAGFNGGFMSQVQKWIS